MPIVMRMILVLLLVVAAEYYSFLVVRSLTRALPFGWRNGLTAIYLLTTLFAWALMFLSRRVDWTGISPSVRNFSIALAIGLFVGKLLILLVMLADELRRGILWVVQRANLVQVEAPRSDAGVSRSVFLQKLAMALGVLSVAAFLKGVTNRYRYRVNTLSLTLPNLPAVFRGLRIVQISDIHSGSFDDPKAVSRGVDEILAQKPDLILFTGDLVNNRASELVPYLSIFSRLKAPLGVFSILGNHDYGDYVAWPSEAAKKDNLNTLKRYHRDMGWRLLLNEHAIIERDGARFALLGVENWGAKAGFPKYGKLAAAYLGLKPDDGTVKILMSHDPSHWDAQVRTDFPDINLTLSGHTHGMQFGIEIPGFKWSPVQYVYTKWAGLYQEANQFLYVNRGFGFLGYHGRVGILPEITVITLA